MEWEVYCDNFVRIGLTADAGDNFKNRVPIPLAPSIVSRELLTLIHMLDQNRCYLVNTGASFSILPHHSSLPATGPKLFGAATRVQLHFRDHNFSRKFLLANAAFPVLGVDFLRYHKL